MSATGGDPSNDKLPAAIGRPATRALEAHGVTRLRQLTGRSERELLALHGVGPKAIRIIRERLAEAGLEPLAP
jgi:predicted flap endonuclease-1-like 5' DNA nuclease